MTTRDVEGDAGSHTATAVAGRLRARGYTADVGGGGGVVVLDPATARALLERLDRLQGEVTELRKPPY